VTLYKYVHKEVTSCVHVPTVLLRGAQQHLYILEMFRMLKTFISTKVITVWRPERGQFSFFSLLKELTFAKLVRST